MYIAAVIFLKGSKDNVLINAFNAVVAIYKVTSHEWLPQLWTIVIITGERTEVIITRLSSSLVAKEGIDIVEQGVAFNYVACISTSLHF